jgi:glutamyl-tRNA(Gln) amidotransferase subunit D
MKKISVKDGDLVEAKKGKTVFSGYVIPSKEKGLLTLKLKSGYNIGLELKSLDSVKRLGSSKKPAKPPLKKIAIDSSLPMISILHTGGTIASRVDYRTGSVVSAFSPEDILSMFPELASIANFDSKLIGHMWSHDLRFQHFSLIAKEIEKEFKKGAKGVIIGIGTDNLAVTAAALAFALEKCPFPVVVVGAQRSSDRGSSDAEMNLVCAAEFVSKTDFAGVAICMHESTSDDCCVILPPCKTRKLHTSRRDAFKPVNDSPIARINYNSKEIEFIKKDYSRRSNEKMVVKPSFEERVALLKVTVNMFPEQFDFFSKKNFKGLVIEGTGLGHMPGHTPDAITKKHSHQKFFSAIRALTKKAVVVMSSQCLFGRVQMNVYSKGRDLQELGVIPGEDLLPETAFVKLAWLLGNYKDKNKVKELMTQNLRGEISNRTILV